MANTLILKEGLSSFRFRKYVFFPNKPLDVSDEVDAYDIVATKRVVPYGNSFVIKQTTLPVFNAEAKEGQLKIGIIRIEIKF